MVEGTRIEFQKSSIKLMIFISRRGNIYVINKDREITIRYINESLTEEFNLEVYI